MSESISLGDYFDLKEKHDALVARLAELERALSEAHKALRDKCERLVEAEEDLRETREFRDKAVDDLNTAKIQDIRKLLTRLAEAEADTHRLDWIEAHLLEGKWDGTISRPKSWHMIGPYRHTLQKMCGDTLREAIDILLTPANQPTVVQHKRGCAYLVDAAYKVPSPCTCGAEAEALLREAREDWLHERKWVGGVENGRWESVGTALLAFIRKVDAFLTPDSGDERE